MAEKPRSVPPDHIPRPCNSFMLFRKENCPKFKKLRKGGKISRSVAVNTWMSSKWDGVSPEERLLWEERAKKAKAEHLLKYPWYKYRPRRKSKEEKKDKKDKKKQNTRKSENTPPSSAASVPHPDVSSLPTIPTLDFPLPQTTQYAQGETFYEPAPSEVDDFMSSMLSHTSGTDDWRSIPQSSATYLWDDACAPTPANSTSPSSSFPSTPFLSPSPDFASFHSSPSPSPSWSPSPAHLDGAASQVDLSAPFDTTLGLQLDLPCQGPAAMMPLEGSATPLWHGSSDTTYLSPSPRFHPYRSRPPRMTSPSSSFPSTPFLSPSPDFTSFNSSSAPDFTSLLSFPSPALAPLDGTAPQVNFSAPCDATLGLQLDLPWQDTAAMMTLNNSTASSWAGPSDATYLSPSRRFHPYRSCRPRTPSAVYDANLGPLSLLSSTGYLSGPHFQEFDPSLPSGDHFGHYNPEPWQTDRTASGDIWYGREQGLGYSSGR